MYSRFVCTIFFVVVYETTIAAFIIIRGPKKLYENILIKGGGKTQGVGMNVERKKKSIMSLELRFHESNVCNLLPSGKVTFVIQSCKGLKALIGSANNLKKGYQFTR